MNNIISVKQLEKTFGSGESAVRALRGMNFEISKGDFVIIFGPSGSGKSTLLNIISGLDTPTAGSIEINGQKLEKLTESEQAIFHRDTLGLIFQSYNLLPALTVLQNITLPLVFSRKDKKQRDKIGLSLLKKFELEKLHDRLPTEISGGQQQRVGIMRALSADPPIIIADEPTGNLDSKATQKVMDILSDLNKEFKKTLLLVTHDPSLFKYANKIIHVLDGEVTKIEDKKQERETKKRKPVDEKHYLRLKQIALKAKMDHILDLLEVFLNTEQLAHFKEVEFTRTIDLIHQTITNKITVKDLQIALDSPIKEGGAGLYKPTAKHISQKIENIMRATKKI